MSKHWKIRPLLWSALIFALLGSIIGGGTAYYAIQYLARGTTAIGTFERLWSLATIQDTRATAAAREYIYIGDTDKMDAFMALKDVRNDTLLRAREVAPELKDDEIVSRTYDAALAMSDIELAAVSLAKQGNFESARKMLKDARYAQLGTVKNKLKERARYGLYAALNNAVQEANTMLWLGLLGLLLSLSFAAYCWWQVGQLFKRQAQELMVARDALSAHANQLEERIEARTKDLESAKEAAESADMAKSAFLAQMSHEIRTPMNGVLGMASALSNTNLDERQQRLVSVIQESGDILLSLLNDVLDIAKIEAGKLEIEETSFNLADVINSAEAIFSTRAHDKGISLAVNISDAANIWCIGDPTRLKQIIYNLISNAVKFTSEGYVNVDVEVQDKDDAYGITLSVLDTGIGMDEETQARLFQRFAQADVSTTRKYGGTGLGLAICKQLAHLMGGDVIVKSEIGKGSDFILTLSVKKGKEPAKTDAQSFEQIFEEEGECVEDLRILAAEDNANNRLVLKMFLEQVGVHPIFVENGELAVEEWKKQEFDIILMDVQMPIMSGPEATAEIRRLEKQMKRPRTPIIALTANAMTHHVKECIDAGMDAHVAKPIRPDLLFAAIDTAIEQNINKVAKGMEEEISSKYNI